jgi:hypothetical protein
MSAEIIAFPIWRVLDEGRFPAFDDEIKGEIVLLPLVRIERAEEKPQRRRAQARADGGDG